VHIPISGEGGFCDCAAKRPISPPRTRGGVGGGVWGLVIPPPPAPPRVRGGEPSPEIRRCAREARYRRKWSRQPPMNADPRRSGPGNIARRSRTQATYGLWALDFPFWTQEPRPKETLVKNGS
jgi:hypothetical protein